MRSPAPAAPAGPLRPRITCVDELVYRSPSVWIGRFHCAPEHPLFRDSGPASAHLFVFPRSSVRIRHAGRREFLSSRNVVTYYNRGDEYRRAAVSAEGDVCDWFAIASQLAAGVVAREDPRAEPHGERVFRFDHGPCDALSYHEQRVLARRAARGADPLEVEEGAVRILGRLVRGARAAGDGAFDSAGEPLRPAHLELAEAARLVLAERLAAPLTLEDVARAVGCSPYHLCRVFRRATASSLHEYRSQLRLRRAVDLIEQGADDFSRLALELGYSSHSHFTHAYRRAFGAPPRALRLAVRGGPEAPPRRRPRAAADKRGCP